MEIIEYALYSEVQLTFSKNTVTENRRILIIFISSQTI